MPVALEHAICMEDRNQSQVCGRVASPKARAFLKKRKPDFTDRG
jgi:ribosomal protein L13